jgi:DNA-binding PadR family transcriptional regulator
MTPSPRDLRTHTPLTAATFNILLALAGGEKHGYAIMLEVTEHTEGRLQLAPGTLYGAI